MGAFIYIPAISAISFITICASTVEGTLVGVALCEWVAVATSIYAGVFTHTCPFFVYPSQDTETAVGTRNVAARHVSITSCGQLTFIHIIADEAITLVSILALAEVGAISVAAQSLDATVVW